MKVFLIGSTQYDKKFQETKKQYEKWGHKVRLPAMDFHELNELEITSKNLENIQWADLVVVFWDGRSTGTIFDLGMVFALNKPLKIGYLEKKSLVEFVKQYEQKHIIERRE